LIGVAGQPSTVRIFTILPAGMMTISSPLMQIKIMKQMFEGLELKRDNSSAAGVRADRNARQERALQIVARVS
jgi:hypothetical protein